MSFICSVFEPETLNTIHGYSLQAFSSGRFKLSFHAGSHRRYEYYVVAPKRDREAYRRQKLRSETLCPSHFQFVDRLLAERGPLHIFRVHEKTNSNDTTDNAHLLLDVERREACVVIGEVLHLWPLPEEVLADVLRAHGERRGAASVFNEYLLTYEHEWTNYEVQLEDYSRGYRNAAPTRTRRRAQVVRPFEDEDDLF